MRLESAFAINLRIGIAVVLGTTTALIASLVTSRGLLDELPLGSLISAGVLLGSYVVIPARVDRDRE